MWAPEVGRFLSSPGGAGIAAICAASIAARALYVQLAHTKMKDKTQSWWDSFEWVAERAVPSKAEDEALPLALSINILNSLQETADNELQQRACGGFVTMLTAKLSAALDTAGSVAATAKEGTPIEVEDSDQEEKESVEESAQPPADTNEQKPRRRWSSETNGALIEGFILREITRQEAEKALGDYVKATSNTPAKSEAGEEYISAQGRTLSMAESYEKSVYNGLKEVLPAGCAIWRGSRDSAADRGDISMTLEGRRVAVEVSWMLLSVKQADAHNRMRSILGRFRRKSPDTPLLIVTPIRLKESFVAEARKAGAEIVTWKSRDNSQVLAEAIQRLRSSADGLYREQTDN